MWRVNYRQDNLELRSCDEHLIPSNDEHTTLEIIRWYNYNDGEKEYCCVIAYYEISKEYVPSLKFVSDRPFSKDVDKDVFWQLAQLGNKILTSKMEREHEDE